MSAPLTSDIQAPFDPTGFTSITGAQLLQLISGAYPQIDTGFIKVTIDGAGNTPTVPNALLEPKWQKYIWVRVSNTLVTGYLWNPNAGVDPTLLQWVPFNQAGIAAGSIVNSMIADNTIQDAKIASLSYSKLIGAPAGLVPSGAAGGVLTGTYPNPSIAGGAVTGAMIALLTITAANIAAQGVSLANLAAVSGSAKDMARVNAGATAMEAFTPPSIFTSGVVVTTGNQFKVPQVATAGAGDTGTWQMVAPTAIGRILQIVETDTTALYQNTGVLANSTSTPNYNSTGVSAITGLNTAFTPLSASSTLLIELTVNCYQSANGMGFIGVWTGTGAVAPIGLVPNSTSNTASTIIQNKLVCKLASPGTGAMTFYPAFGTTITHMYINSIDNANNPFLVSQSSLKITEYI